MGGILLYNPTIKIFYAKLFLAIVIASNSVVQLHASSLTSPYWWAPVWLAEMVS